MRKINKSIVSNYQFVLIQFEFHWNSFNVPMKTKEKQET